MDWDHYSPIVRDLVNITILQEDLMYTTTNTNLVRQRYAMTITVHTDHRIILPSQCCVDSQQSNTADPIDDPSQILSSWYHGNSLTHSLNSTCVTDRSLFLQSLWARVVGLFSISPGTRPRVTHSADSTSHPPWLLRNALLFVIILTEHPRLEFKGVFVSLPIVSS